MATIELVGLGAMNIDRLYRVDEIVIDGEQVATDSESFPGGSAANTIYGLAKLGVKTGFVGAVGKDGDSEELIKSFKAIGVDTSQIRVKQTGQAGSTICLSDKLGRRAIYVSPGANNLLTSKDVSIGYLNQAHIVHLSSFANDKQFELQIDIVKKMRDSVKISLAPGTIYAAKGLKPIVPLIEKTFVIFLNRSEIELLTGIDFRAGTRELLKLGCKVIVVTLGKGLTIGKTKTITSYIRDAKKEYQIEVDQEDPESRLETTGAGDAFAAGFLFGLLNGKKIEGCGLLGNIMASFAIIEVGARNGLPSLAQLSQRYFQRSGHKL
jgi:ribokinase